MLNKIGENTDNIKYVGNTWQKSGSIENASCMYTPENLLNLFYREYEYNKGEMIYRLPVDVDVNEVQPALLHHDLILVNLHYYTGTETDSSNVIYALKDYLAYGIGIGNPVYDPSFKVKYIPLVTEEALTSDTSNAGNKPLNDFIKDIGEGVTSFSIDNILTLFRVRYELETKPNGNQSLRDFYNGLKPKCKEKFIRDFSLPVHDPDSIKLPFYNQSLDGIEEHKKNSNRIATRFVLNSAALSGKFNNDFSYVEQLSNVAELVLTTLEGVEPHTYIIKDYNNLEVTSYALEATEANKDTDAYNYITKVLQSEEVTNNFPPEDKIDMIASEGMLSKLSTAGTTGGFGSMLSPLYIGYNPSVDMRNSQAIQLCIPQDKATILINEEEYETWDIFGGLVLGFKLVDALIAQRTFIGSIWAWGTIGDINNKITIHNTSGSSDKDIPLYKSLKNYPDAKSENDANPWSIDYTYNDDTVNYLTINILNKIYNTYGNPTTEWDSARLTPPVMEWLKKESVIFKAPFFGDFVEEKNFEQDLTPNSKVAFKEVFVDKEKGGKGRYKDSITRVPYIEQTMPLIYKPEGVEIENAKASTTFPGTSNLKDDVSGYSIIPPFISDSEKGDESELLEEGSETIAKTGAGSIRVEERIISKTIDELWTYIKKLSEDDSSAALPKFYGIKASKVDCDEVPAVRLNTKYIAGHPADEKYIDILSWEPKTVEDEVYPSRPYSNENNKELTFKGWKVTDHIVKYLDYEIKPFSRDTEVDEFYEFGPTSKGYLTQLYNSIETSLGFIEESTKVLNDDLLNRYSRTFDAEDDKTLTEEADLNLSEDQIALRNILTQKQEHARKSLAKILTFDVYKEYLTNPKNLKTIERDLEELKLNVKMLADYLVAAFVMKGAFDRATDRGTLHTLHRNHFEFEDTLIPETDEYLNDVSGSLEEDIRDQKVWFEDGAFEVRYVHPDNTYFNKLTTKKGTFGTLKIVKNEDATFEREERGLVKEDINKISLRQIYLAADGTWRSIHDNFTLPIVDDEF